MIESGLFFFSIAAIGTPSQNNCEVGASPDVKTDPPSVPSVLQGSSFEVISLGSR